ncbi:A/G-specific adenine glycosylase [Rhodobacteraceae bacterium MBR-64]
MGEKRQTATRGPLRHGPNGATERSADLLIWYDAHARDMPWRTGPAARAAGVRPDPYRVWLSEIMLQQTTVAAVAGYFRRFTERWPDVAALAAADDGAVMAEWAGLGYYARARNLLTCARKVVRDHAGQFPQTEAGLRTLPGIGPYTAAAIAAIAHDAPATVVDGNVERVVARLFAVTDPLPGVKPRLAALAATLTPPRRPGDHAQAMMDLGATICTPRRPACGICPFSAGCAARLAGIAPDLPRRSLRPAKPLRLGVAWLARRDDGAWLLERRPDRGLLGGMLSWPTTEWAETLRPAPPPIEAAWTDIAGEVRHTFTHFHLRLTLRLALVGSGATPRAGQFVPAAQFRRADLPTVMRKALDLAQSAIASRG